MAVWAYTAIRPIRHYGLVQNPQQACASRTLDVPLRVGRWDGDAHLQDDLLPRARVGDAVGQRHPVLLRLPRPRLHPLQLRQQGAEQLELPGVADLAVGAHRFDLRQDEVLGSRLAGELVDPRVPRLELRIFVGEAADAPFQLDEAADRP